MSDLNLFVRHLIKQYEFNGYIKEIVLYLNAATPYKYEYWVNSYNKKSGCGSSAGYDTLEIAMDSYNRIVLIGEIK